MSEERKHEIKGDNGGGRQVSLPVDLPSNSHKTKKVTIEDLKTSKVERATERQKLEKLVAGEVKRKKVGFWDKTKETFAGEDARSVGQYLIFDVFVPALKDMIADAAAQGTQRLLFGESSSRSRPRDRERDYVPYGRMSTSRGGGVSRRESRDLTRRERATHNFDKVIIDTKREADDILDALDRRIDEYGSAYISDLYDLIGVTSEFTDESWGWYDLREAGVRRVREGYLLLLPRPEVIK